VGALKLQYGNEVDIPIYRNKASLRVVYRAATNGTVVEETNYDPWGRIRNADTWEYPSESVAQSHALTKTTRGYTGHEHLQHFALINMNGRMYDPVLGRMLSPDNYVQDPSNAQNYNRYAYVLNNPLKYTDSSGEFLEELWNGIGWGVAFVVRVATVPLAPTGFTAKYWSALYNSGIKSGANNNSWESMGNGFANGGKAMVNFGIIVFNTSES
jgi:RHS repeat-associated protein